MPMTTPVNILPLENKEQWGVYTTGTYSNPVQITLPIPMSDSKYAIVATSCNTNSHRSDNVDVYNRTNSTVKIKGSYNEGVEYVQTAAIIVAGK